MQSLSRASGSAFTTSVIDWRAAEAGLETASDNYLLRLGRRRAGAAWIDRMGGDACLRATRSRGDVRHSDSTGRGFLRVEGSPSLERFINNVAKGKIDPETRLSVWERLI